MKNTNGQEVLFGLHIAGRLDGQTDEKVGTDIIFGSDAELVARLDELKGYVFTTSEEGDVLSKELIENGYLVQVSSDNFRVAQQ